MSTDKLIFKPTDRNSITKIEPNNYAVGILDDRVFDIETGRSLILNAIENIDTGLLSGNVNINLIVNALELKDSSIIAVENIISAIILETESLDTILIEARAILSAYLLNTDSPDTAEIETAVDVNIALDKKEQTDISNIIISTAGDRNLSLEVTENKDSANIKASRKTYERPRTYIPLSRYNFDNYDYSLTVKLKASENKDGCKINIISDIIPVVNIQENADGVTIASRNIDIANVSISENRDGVINDVEDFKEKVRIKNEIYEQSELELFAMVA